MTTRLWLEDIKIGTTLCTGSHTVTTDEIVSFAAQYDPQPFHLSEASAADTFFGGLAASGWHTAAITMRLLVTSGLPIAHGIIGARMELVWPTPTRPGDELHVELLVTDVTPAPSLTAPGFVTTEHSTLNQAGKLRQRTKARIVVFNKPPG
ncbi:MaoC family dehydratase [Nocardia sp. CA-107356]|uniref:MaoC family dehydratase n=1 Tax=Nocardia sp. CA-107356 TaxID=3239972 RepID=UPI003D90CE60